VRIEVVNKKKFVANHSYDSFDFTGLYFILTLYVTCSVFPEPVTYFKATNLKSLAVYESCVKR